MRLGLQNSSIIRCGMQPNTQGAVGDSVARILAVRTGYGPRVYTVTPTALTFEQDLAVPTGWINGVVTCQFSVDDKYVIAGGRDDYIAVAEWDDGTLGSWGAQFAVGGQDVDIIVPHPTDPSLFIGTKAFSHLAVYRINSDLSITELAGITGSGSIGRASCWPTWSPDGTRIVTGTGAEIQLHSWDGATVTEIDTIASFGGGADAHHLHWMGSGTQVFAGNTNHTQIQIVDTAGDTLSIVATQSGLTSAGNTGAAVSPSGNFAIQGERNDPARVWDISGGTITEVDALPDPSYNAVWFSDELFATIDDSSGNIETRLYSLVSGVVTELDEELSSNSQAVRIARNSVTPF